MSKTEKNLQDAFAGESQANRKYLAFAKKADREGYKQVAKLFRAAAEAETVHAHNHLKELRGIKSTRENLETAIHGEDNKSALRSFNYANAVEKVHADLYKKALEDIGKNKEVDYYVCQVCGFTAEETAPEKCPVCGSKKELFTHIG
jgi:rubrerythrin